MEYVITKQGLEASARILANAVGNGISVRYTVLRDVPPLIRWGTSTGAEKFSAAQQTSHNSARAIHLCGSKTALSRALVEAGVPTVEFKMGEPTVYPIAVRKTLNGHGGEGIVICKTREEWSQYQQYWWSPWYTFKYELGVHILGGAVKKVFKKVWQDDVDTEPEFPLRNIERGYHFSVKNPDLYQKLGPFVEQFYNVVGINMARLDIGWDDVAKTYRIIEANSAPALTANVNTAAMYVEYIRSVLGN